MLVCEYLDFHMFGVDQELLHEYIIVAKRFKRLGFDKIKVDSNLFYIITAAHAAAAASGRRLEDDREAERHRKLLRLFAALQRILGAGRCGDIAVERHLLGAELVAHHIQNIRLRADKLDAGLFAGSRKVTVLGKETVTGVNRVAVVHSGEFNDSGNVQVGPQRALVFSDQIGFICGCAKCRVCILCGINRNSLQPQIVAGTEDAHRDLTAVCHQDFFEFCHSLSFIKCHDIRQRRLEQMDSMLLLRCMQQVNCVIIRIIHYRKTTPEVDFCRCICADNAFLEHIIIPVIIIALFFDVKGLSH